MTLSLYLLIICLWIASLLGRGVFRKSQSLAYRVQLSVLTFLLIIYGAQSVNFVIRLALMTPTLFLYQPITSS